MKQFKKVTADSGFTFVLESASVLQVLRSLFEEDDLADAHQRNWSRI